MRLSSSPSTSQVQVKPVSWNRQDLRQFYQVPFHLYDHTSQWTPPFYNEFRDFFSNKNKFWDHAEAQLYIATKNGKTTGRIAAIIDRTYCKTVNEQIGFFGFFECIEEYDIAQALFKAAEDWLIAKGMKILRGPIDGRVDVGCGFLIKGFESPQTLLATYTPPYYADFAEQYGMKKCKDLLTYRIDLTRPLPARLEEKVRACHAAGITLRPFNRLRTGRELSWWIPLFLETFHDHWGFVPVTPDEVRQRFGVRQLRWFVDSRLFVIAEIDKKPVGYLWATPEYNQIFRQMHGRLGPRELLLFLRKQKTITDGKLHFIGISPNYLDKGIASCLNHAVFAEMQRRGYRTAEIGWIDEANTAAHNTMAVSGTSVVKVHRVYEKNLQVTPHG